MTPLEWAGTMIAGIIALFGVFIGLAIWAQARMREADLRDTGHHDNKSRRDWCEWLRKEE
jgi:hypothetical protein